MSSRLQKTATTPRSLLISECTDASATAAYKLSLFADPNNYKRPRRYLVQPFVQNLCFRKHGVFVQTPGPLFVALDRPLFGTRLSLSPSYKVLYPVPGSNLPNSFVATSSVFSGLSVVVQVCFRLVIQLLLIGPRHPTSSSLYPSNIPWPNARTRQAVELAPSLLCFLQQSSC